MGDAVNPFIVPFIPVRLFVNLLANIYMYIQGFHSQSDVQVHVIIFNPKHPRFELSQISQNPLKSCRIDIIKS